MALKTRRIAFAAALALGLVLTATQRASAQTSPPPPAAPQTTDAQDNEPVGNVATLQGIATVTRNNSISALKVQDDIFKNDILQTAANSTLSVTFSDETTFNLTANSRIAVDNFVYEDGGKINAALFNVARGTVAFVAAAVARTGDMKISTPTATLGIRGTTGVVEVPEGAAPGTAANVGIKLYPDADGRVGHIDITGRDGARLGSLTRGATGFAIRPGAGGRFTAFAVQISPQQARRDRGFVRQVHTAQGIGRGIVTQQRALRLQRNPQLQRQPGLQQRPGLPQRQQPGLQRPNSRQPGLQNPQRPGAPTPSPQQRVPGVQQQGQRVPGVQTPLQQRAPGVQRPPGQRIPPGVRLPRQPAPKQKLPSVPTQGERRNRF